MLSLLSCAYQLLPYLSSPCARARLVPISVLACRLSPEFLTYSGPESRALAPAPSARSSDEKESSVLRYANLSFPLQRTLFLWLKKSAPTPSRRYSLILSSGSTGFTVCFPAWIGHLPGSPLVCFLLSHFISAAWDEVLILGRSSPPPVFKGLGHLKSCIFMVNFWIVSFHQNKDWDLDYDCFKSMDSFWGQLVALQANFSSENGEFPSLFRSLKMVSPWFSVSFLYRNIVHVSIPGYLIFRCYYKYFIMFLLLLAGIQKYNYFLTIDRIQQSKFTYADNLSVDCWIF